MWSHPAEQSLSSLTAGKGSNQLTLLLDGYKNVTVDFKNEKCLSQGFVSKKDMFKTGEESTAFVVDSQLAVQSHHPWGQRKRKTR